MRNPKNSWDRSDSIFGKGNYDNAPLGKVAKKWEDAGYDYNERVLWLFANGALNNSDGNSDYALLGPNDMKLAQSLIEGGNEHRKFLRQIFVTIDISAPFYIWKELDTYKVGTVSNSCSTMHKITSAPITMESFETEDYSPETLDPDVYTYGPQDIVNFCEQLRQNYLAMKDENPEEAKKIWKELIRWLPEGWLQKRTWTANYEVLRSIYHQRKNHKLTEWHSFCDMISCLPYGKEFIKN